MGATVDKIRRTAYNVVALEVDMPRWPYLVLLAIQAVLAAAAFAAWKGVFVESIGTIPGYWVALAAALLLGTIFFVFLERET